jgi:hypothetical protein
MTGEEAGQRGEQCESFAPRLYTLQTRGKEKKKTSQQMKGKRKQENGEKGKRNRKGGGSFR